MSTTTMDQNPLEQAPVRSSPFQVCHAVPLERPLRFECASLPATGKARALRFFKKFVLARRKGSRKSTDVASPVAIPTQEFQRAHSSVDLVRKPDLSRLIRLRVDDCPNSMDTDDSSQDAPSPSGNASCLRPRRHSTMDSLPTVHCTYAGQGSGNSILGDHPGNLLAPAPFFLQSNLSLSQQPARSLRTSPETPQANIPLELTPDEAVHDKPNDDTPRPFPHDVLTNPMIDPGPSTSSHSGVPSETQSLLALEESASETAQARPALLPHHTSPLPPPFRLTTERGLRLSPSIITRQPVPLLNLPTLPSPAPVLDTPPRERERLRSVPSLFRHSRMDSGRESDHESTTIGELDDEDGDDDDDDAFVDASSVHHQSDDDEDEPSGAGPPATPSLKSAEKRPMEDDGSPAESSISPASSPAGPNLTDFFCSPVYVQSIHVAASSTSLEMYPFSPSIPSVGGPPQRQSLEPDLVTSGSRLEKRPNLSRVASQSMINLGSMRVAERPLIRSREASNTALSSGRVTESHEEWEEVDMEAAIGRLLRRTSMPSFHPTSDPPPYPTFDPRPKEIRVVPREDEGRERLPPYNNSLYLIAIMPRKMEFSSPGVQARDRKWRRVVCELEGTTFRVYRCPPGASGAGVLGDWWEKHVGVGDVAGPNPSRVRKKPEEQLERPAKLGIDEPSATATPPASSSRSTSVAPRRRTASQSSIVTQTTIITTPRHAKRASATSFLSPFRSSGSTRLEASAGESSHPESRELELMPVDSHSSVSHEDTGRAIPVAQPSAPPLQSRSASRLGGLSFLPVVAARASGRNGEISKPPKSDLLHAYTLQHAQSGLGNDYLKRKNVIRVRLEGEQFLLQAPDIPAVVEWIEGLHAGTNIALDLDERPMPKGPMFPRRRRRRTRRTQPQSTSGQRPSESS